MTVKKERNNYIINNIIIDIPSTSNPFLFLFFIELVIIITIVEILIYQYVYKK